MANHNRSVFKNEDGKWANKRDDATRAASLHDTQKEATDAAREMIRNEGGGELTVHGEDGEIRSKDTIPHGNDPFPPKG